MTTFRVYHKTTPTFFDNDAVDLDIFPSGFTLVAVVETDEVGRVFQLTNHIDSNWTKNPEVCPMTPAARAGQVRSTSVGDVVVEQGVGKDRRFTIDGIGLREF
jgi:hypothetical protein